MFYLKKLIEYNIYPLPIIILLLIIGLVLLFLHKRAGRWLVLIATILLLILCMPWTANLSINPLQQAYPVLSKLPQNVHYIVVLGGGSTPIKHAPANNTVNYTSTMRLVEGIRLWRQQPRTKLLLSGANYAYPQFNDGDTMAKTAELLGVPRSAIIIENKALDTASQAIAIHKMIGKQPFALVTSAYHIPRSMRLFKAQGMHPIAAPCNFLYFGGNDFLSKMHYDENLVGATTAWHEYLGLMALTVRGK